MAWGVSISGVSVLVAEMARFAVKPTTAPVGFSFSAPAFTVTGASVASGTFSGWAWAWAAPHRASRAACATAVRESLWIGMVNGRELGNLCRGACSGCVGAAAGLGPAAQPVVAGGDSRMTMRMIGFFFFFFLACKALVLFLLQQNMSLRDLRVDRLGEGTSGL